MSDKKKELFLKQVYKKIEYADIVSFDIFDTLLCRNVPDYRDIFELVSIRAMEKGVREASKFIKERLQAAEQAKMEAVNGEATYDNIYECLNGFSKDDKKVLKGLELELERLYLQKRDEIYTIYQYCKKLNKKIIAVSDMYLASDVLNEILESNGIICEKVFVSCEYKLNKRSGNIYKEISKELGCEKKNILHIGDSLKSDYINALQNGWKAVHVPQKEKKLLEYGNISEKVVNSVLVNNYSADCFYQLGFSVLGPILFGFCQWLHMNMYEKGISQKVFLAREGKIIKSAYDAIYENEQTYYIHVSRVALSTPILWAHCEFEKLKKIIILPKNVTLKTFVLRLGLDWYPYEEIALEMKLDTKKTYGNEEFWDSESVKKFYEAIKEDVCANSKVQYELVTEYLKRCFGTERVGIVDVGWRGSMQKCLKMLVELSPEIFKSEITGFYLGIENVNSDVEGYFYKSEKQTVNKTIIDASFGLFESMFLAQEGTTLGYDIIDKRVIPVLASYENADSHVTECLSRIHIGAMDFLKKVKKLGLQNMDLIEADKIVGLYKRVALCPTKEEVKEFGNIQFNDGQNVSLISARGKYTYLKRPSYLADDYFNATWKIGFLKVAIANYVPWGKIYMKMKSKKNKGE